MTGNKDNNVTPQASNHESNDASGDDAWAEFVSAHQDDLHDVAHSRSARKFNKAAKKAEKQAQINVDDLKAEAFAAPPITGAGPRDFQGRSWMDTDDVMDEASPFTPPNPDIGPIRKSNMLFTIMLIVGILCLCGAIVLPTMSSMLGAVGGVLTLLGGGGLFANRRHSVGLRTDDSP